MANYADRVINQVVARDPNQIEFIQAVKEVLETLSPILDSDKKYEENSILERIVEPERVIMFRVPWVDDAGRVQVNRAFRIQFNSAIGPYKGGLRFHPSVNLSILKFLAFEQIFKNSLTTLPMGGGKGGCDFDPRGKTDGEVMRFCQSFMSELSRHIGSNTDVPAGDIGVGAREIGYLFGQYKKLKKEFTGVLTGKSLNWGGSLIRPEATGYGCVYFVEEMLKANSDSLKDKMVAISGSGNVAQFACEKVNSLGGKVVSFSDSDGTIFDPDGIDNEKLAYVMDLKNVQRGRIKDYVGKYQNATFAKGNPWSIDCDIALPCATQNEISTLDAKELIKNNCLAVSEGANMPTTPDAVECFQKANVLYGPGKAANAGGVAVSGLEMSQNSIRTNWTREEVDSKLQSIMQSIHKQCITTAEYYGCSGDYVTGANIAGFTKVADSMIDQGVV
ncbi:NADP-specific glutamate dehydrogenase [bacterium]|nr:NADP-specific glutamate dehydrogenase [bacterium]|tara:strand:+ start:275 stop:1615 length:1341 start_codon:yes stop_codon:yes gene_type:complete